MSHINTSTPEWREIVRLLTERREDVRRELEAFNTDASRRDDTDFLRGRIYELTQLIELKGKD